MQMETHSNTLKCVCVCVYGPEECVGAVSGASCPHFSLIESSSPPLKLLPVIMHYAPYIPLNLWTHRTGVGSESDL